MTSRLKKAIIFIILSICICLGTLLKIIPVPEWPWPGGYLLASELGAFGLFCGTTSIIQSEPNISKFGSKLLIFHSFLFILAFLPAMIFGGM